MAEHHLHREIVGDPSAERVVVYLHGGLLGTTMWHAQMRATPGERRVFVDLPGHGRSRHLRWRSMAHTSVLVHALIDEVSPDRPVDLVGVSLGGDVGVKVVCDGPQRIAAAVLSGMISRPQRPWGEVRVAWRQVPRIKSDELLTLFADHNGLPDDARARLRREVETVRYLDYASMLASIYRGMDLPALRRVRTPVLAVCGEGEHLVAHEAVHDLARHGPSVTGVLTEGLGHSWHAEDPSRFDDIVTTWLTEQRLAPRVVQIS